MVRTTAEDDSTEIYDGSEIRIGTFPGNGDVETYAYHPPDGDCWWIMSHGEKESGEAPINSDSISEEITRYMDEYFDHSPFAHAMVRADEIATKTNITRKQAEMYIAREELDWRRHEIARRWDVSRSNVDELVRRANKKIEEARNLVELLD